jgi:REP element-mobilizing transposase RayT
MSRPLRIQAPGLTYHITSRGTGRMAIFVDDCERHEFLGRTADVAARFRLRCHAFCLMTNHYHFVLTTEEANLSAAVKHLNGSYAQWWNRKHGRVGHVFQGRFWAQVIQDESYLLTVCRYIVLNPVRAGFVSDPGDWRWSSYRATAGFATAVPFLTTQWVWRRLGNSTEDAQSRYRAFVSGPIDAKSPPKINVLGDASFSAQFRHVQEHASPEVPLRTRRAAPDLRTLFRDCTTRAARCAAAARAQAWGYSAEEIARFLEIHRSTASRMMLAARAAARLAAPSDPPTPSAQPAPGSAASAAD